MTGRISASIVDVAIALIISAVGFAVLAVLAVLFSTLSEIPR